MVAQIKPTQPSPHASRNSPSTFPSLADATMQYALIDGPDYVEAAADFSEIQPAIAEAAAQDLLTSFTDFSGDVDGLTSNGIYKLATGVTNAFAGAGDNDFLFNLYYDASNQTQFGYEGGAYTHLRSKVGGVWGAWGPTYKIATQAKAEAGTDDVDAMTALKTKQAVDVQVPALFSASGSAPIFAARAWANYDLTGAVLRDSGNVSSVTKNGTGDYTVNFATPMNSATYSPLAATGNVAAYSTLTTTTMRLLNKTAGGTLIDSSFASSAVLGD